MGEFHNLCDEFLPAYCNDSQKYEEVSDIRGKEMNNVAISISLYKI